MNKLYHGSNIPNLKILTPDKSGYVYATSEFIFALIFSIPQRSSLLASWGTLEDGTPYLCEKTENIFHQLYDKVKSSIYVLDSKNFFQKDNSWVYEFLSTEKEPVLEEIKVKDVKKYLLQMEKENRFKLIKYKDSKSFFPNIDQETMGIVLALSKKYGKEVTLRDVKRWRPDLLEEVVKKLP